MALLAMATQPLYDLLQFLISLVLGPLVVLPALLIGIIKRGTKKGTSTYGIYQSVANWPFGRFMYTKLVTYFTPYSGSIYAEFVHLEPGKCHMKMADRPWLRNPFNSLHAVALCNLAELAGGMAAKTAIEDVKGAMGIPVTVKMEYFVKARGTVEVKAEMPSKIPETPGMYPMKIKCDIVDGAGKIVASAEMDWSIKVREPKKTQ